MSGMFSREVIWQADLVLLGGMTLVGFLVMWVDKTIARRNGRAAESGKRLWRRVPERTLFFIAALGGSVGVLLGMYAFRHKTLHKRFVFGVPLILAAQLLLGWFLFHQLK